MLNKSMLNKSRISVIISGSVPPKTHALFAICIFVRQICPTNLSDKSLQGTNRDIRVDSLDFLARIVGGSGNLLFVFVLLDLCSSNTKHKQQIAGTDLGFVICPTNLSDRFVRQIVRQIAGR